MGVGLCQTLTMSGATFNTNYILDMILVGFECNITQNVSSSPSNGWVLGQITTLPEEKMTLKKKSRSAVQVKVYTHNIPSVVPA